MNTNFIIYNILQYISKLIFPHSQFFFVGVDETLSPNVFE